MKKFDETYILLQSMVNDSYFPPFLVEKTQALLLPVIHLLESGETNISIIQQELDDMTLAINDLQYEFEENDSEIETAARDSIGETVGYILDWFDIPIEIEDALGERDW